VQGGEQPRRGKVDRSQARHVKQHELNTADRLADLGDDVTFIPSSGQSKRPDVLVNGVRWEFKSPVSTKRNTVMGDIYDGAKQCPNIVLDLSRTSMPLDEALHLAGESVRTYAGVHVVRLIGRTTPEGAPDITIGGGTGG
jgi:hypothetical protein